MQLRLLLTALFYLLRRVIDLTVGLTRRTTSILNREEIPAGHSGGGVDARQFVEKSSSATPCLTPGAGVASLLITVLSIVVLATRLPAQDVAADSVDGDIAVHALADWLGSLTSLDATFRLQWENAPQTICQYARLDDKWYYAEPTYDPGDALQALKGFSNDGDISLAFNIKGIRNNDPASGRWAVQVHDPRQQDTFTPDYLIGQKTSNLSRSLSELLGNPQAFGEPTIKVEDALIYLKWKDVTPGRDDAGGDRYDLDIALDSSHGFLPAHILIKVANNPALAEWANEWDISDFREVTDETTGKPSYFPFRGVMTQGATGAPALTLSLDSVSVNPMLPPSLFSPMLPGGTHVSDLTSAGNASRYISGGIISRDKRLAETSEDVRKESIRNSSSSYFIILGVNLAICAIVFITWIALKRRRARRI